MVLSGIAGGTFPQEYGPWARACTCPVRRPLAAHAILGARVCWLNALRGCNELVTSHQVSAETPGRALGIPIDPVYDLCAAFAALGGAVVGCESAQNSGMSKLTHLGSAAPEPRSVCKSPVEAPRGRGQYQA